MLITVATLATEDLSTVKCCSGYIIIYMGFLIVWASRLQTVFALSTAEAEYIALSTALRNVIPMMDPLSELKEKGFVVKNKPMVHCKLFEDNSGALKFGASGQVSTLYMAHKCHMASFLLLCS
jgi:hypothetical protein